MVVVLDRFTVHVYWLLVLAVTMAESAVLHAVCCTGNGSWIPPPESGQPVRLDPSPSHQNIWLFNIEADPTETTDVSSSNPEVNKVNELSSSRFDDNNVLLL